MYWELLTSDGEVKYIAPQYAEAIKQAISSGRDHIGGNELIRVRDIKRFRESEKPYIGESRQLDAGELAEAQAAFGTPIVINDTVKAIAVKKRVPTRKIEYYQKSGYRLLKEEENGAWFGYWIPAHLYDSTKHERATVEEAHKIP